MASERTPLNSEPVVFRPSIMKLSAVLAGSLAFVAIGIWMLASAGGLPIGIACTALFGFCAAFAGWQLVRRPVMLTVYSDAVENHRGARIRFEDVDHVVLIRVSHSRYLVIMTREGTPSAVAMKASGRMQGMNETFLPGGSRAMWISSVAVGIPLDQLAQSLSAMVPCEIVRLP